MSVEKLVVDANAFIKGYPLEMFSPTVYTVPDVIKEIRDSATKQRLKFTPYDLKLQEPLPTFIMKATDYAKKTGDYSSLSLVDLKVIALAIQLQEEFSPVNFKEAPVKTVFGSGSRNRADSGSSLPIGFYMPKLNFGKHNAYFKTHSYAQGFNFTEHDVKIYREFEGTPIPNDFVYLKRWYNHIDALMMSGHDEMQDSDGEVEESEELSSEETGGATDSGLSENDEEESEDEESDGGGWITPSNYKPKNNLSTAPSPVGILSTDFAIQNVVLHTNLHLVSPDGKKIATLRSYILRCYTCFEKTAQFEKQFCPRCGNKTLRKVSVSVESDGSMKLHFSKRFVVSTRGKKFSLPTPQGGKHAVNPILTEDQPIPQEKRNKKYLARQTGPFCMNDINSRAFFTKSNSTHYWDMRNPNEIKGKGRKKK